MKYWDSSALVPLVVAEVRTEQCEALLRHDPRILTWWSSKVECASAINRLARASVLDEIEVRTALSDLETLWQGITEVQPVLTLRKTALRLLRIHPLKAADALQLAAAIVVAGENREAPEFITFDHLLFRIADLEGFRCIGL